MVGLTAKQQTFVQEYLVDLNATQAAIRAGYEWATSATGFYVYFLIDPRDHAIFYVGKGRGSRMSIHAKRADKDKNSVKSSRILDIQKDGLAVSEIIFAAGLSESAAFAIERRLIGWFREHGLSNMASGVVSMVENQLARIERDISMIRPYAEWIKIAGPEKLAMVDRVFGSPSKFYGWFVDNFSLLRDDAISKLNSINGKSNVSARR